MCGIAGIYNPNGVTTDPAVIRRMSRAIAHRGPDDAGYHLDVHAHLASRRLSIIDLDAGAQPIYSQDNNHAIVYNGEVYNFVALRQELRDRGFHFETHTDTEVILQAYRAWGPDCLQRFQGMFAFCILDVRRQELFLARDRLGIKPLVYSRLPDGTVVFWFRDQGPFAVSRHHQTPVSPGRRQPVDLRFQRGSAHVFRRHPTGAARAVAAGVGRRS